MNRIEKIRLQTALRKIKDKNAKKYIYHLRGIFNHNMKLIGHEINQLRRTDDSLLKYINIIGDDVYKELITEYKVEEVKDDDEGTGC